MEADNLKRKKTWPTAVLLALFVVVIVGIIALVAYALTNPAVFDVVWKTAAIILAAIVLIVVAIAVFAALLAIPMYMYKGEQTQSSGSYGLGDVESVKEKDSEKDEPH